MALHLNNTKIPGFQQKISVSLPLAGEDMSGQSSQTQQAETGDKPKQVQVKTLIRYADAADLKMLVSLAEAKNNASERMIYQILNDTANTMGIRQVRFQDDFNASEDETLEAWTVTFKLVEYRSVPERAQERIKAKPVAQQTASGTPTRQPVNTVVTGSQNTVTPGQEAVNLTGFEKTLKKIDDFLK